MPSRRKLKKTIKKQTDLLIEDAFIEAINGDKKMDQLIDELIDERFDFIAKVSQYPNDKTAKEIREHFQALKGEFSKSLDSYTKKVGKVG